MVHVHVMMAIYVMKLQEIVVLVTIYVLHVMEQVKQNVTLAEKTLI